MSLGEGGSGGSGSDDNDDDDKGLTLTTLEKALTRASDLQTFFVEQITPVFAKDPSLESAMLVVSQHYADNAMDETHGSVVFSAAPTPRWPHVCFSFYRERRGDKQIGPREHCSGCRSNLFDDGYFRWAYNEHSFRAWEAFCSEYANQEQNVQDAYLPYAIARRRRLDHLPNIPNELENKVVLDIEIVGIPVRVWLDDIDDSVRNQPLDKSKERSLFDLVYQNPDDLAARHVLSDALLDRHDVRGEYLAIALSASPSRDSIERACGIEKEHGRDWLGALSWLTPVSDAATTFVHGFPTHLHVYFPDDRRLNWIAESAEEWATVQSLTFLPRSLQPISKLMRHVRAIGPLHDIALGELAEVIVLTREPWDLECLHMVPETDAAASLLLWNRDLAKLLPKLSKLVLSGPWAEGSVEASADGLTLLTHAPLAETIRAIHLATGRPEYEEEGLGIFPPTLLPTFFDRIASFAPHISELAFGPLGEVGEPAGFWIHFLRQHSSSTTFDVAITSPRLGSRFSLIALMRNIEALSQAHRAMFDHRITLRASRFFVPVAADVTMFEEIGIRATIEGQ